MKYFGTDGFRGEAYKELKIEHVEKIAEFVSKNFNSVVIAKDSRESSDDFLNIMLNIFHNNNNIVCNLGLFPTPAASYVVKRLGFDCAIIISASHNSYYDNGIKILNANGEKMMDNVLSDIEEYIDYNTLNENSEYLKGNISEEIKTLLKDDNFNINTYARNEYLDFLKDTFSLNLYKCNLKIAYDCANGSSSNCIKELIEKINYDTRNHDLIIDGSYFNNKPDGKNINNNCGSTNIETFKKFLNKKYSEDKKIYDIVFSFDGDADRLISMYFDEDQNSYKIIDGDIYMYIISYVLKETNSLLNNKIVLTTMSNLGLLNSLRDLSIETSITDVGDRFVYERMKNEDIIFGGEQSGHMIFKNILQTGDGILSSLMLLRAILKHGELNNMTFYESLKDILNKITILPQVLKNIKVKNKDAIMEDQSLLDEIETYSKELGNSSRILIRKSGTENLIRVMVESSTNELCNKICDHFINIIHNINNKL